MNTDLRSVFIREIRGTYVGFAVAKEFCALAGHKASEGKNGFERAFNHNLDVKRMKNTEDNDA